MSAAELARQLAAREGLAPAVQDALADLFRIFAGPKVADEEAFGRWRAHRAAAQAEGLCPLTGDPVSGCRFHRGSEPPCGIGGR